METIYITHITRIILFSVIHFDDLLCEFFFEFVRMFSLLEPIANDRNILESHIGSKLEVGDDEFIFDRDELLIHALWSFIDSDSIGACF